MAEKDANTNLDENAEVESLLNITQDHVVTTKEIVSENVEVDENETVNAKGSKIDTVEVLSQLALFMEMMSSQFDQQKTNFNEFKTEIKSEMNNKFEQQNKNNDNLNTSLNEFKTEMKSENKKIMREINTSSVELKLSLIHI